MQLNARQMVTQFAHLLQERLFPLLQTATGPLSRQMELLSAVVALVPLERMLSARRAGTGRPARDRRLFFLNLVIKPSPTRSVDRKCRSMPCRAGVRRQIHLRREACSLAKIRTRGVSLVGVFISTVRTLGPC